MQEVRMYHDRIIHGIKVSFSNLSQKDEFNLKMLDSYLWGLKYYGNADFQPAHRRIYDYKVIMLHEMAYAYSLQRPEFTTLLGKIIEKLYDVTIDNQELTKLYYSGSRNIPERFQLHHISKPRFDVGFYNYDRIGRKNQRNLDKLEQRNRLTSERTPQKILKKYIQNTGKFNYSFPVFDADVWRLSMIFIFISEANPGDADCFSCFGMLLKKIHDTCRSNTSLRIILDYRRNHS